MAERHACIYTCACVCCVCVQGFLISIPIHMCHVSIWTLISDHMSGKSARVTEYRHRQWAYISRASKSSAWFPMPGHRSQTVGSIHTHRLPAAARRGINRLSHISAYIWRAELPDISSWNQEKGVSPSRLTVQWMWQRLPVCWGFDW